MKRLLTILGCGGLLMVLAGCNATICSISYCEPTSAGAVVAEGAPPPAIVAEGPSTTATVQDPDDVKYYRSDEPLRMGIEHFNRGHYGIAERYFRDAVEKAPKDLTAWVALAATYDRLARFDLADRAYSMAIRLVGETTEILNNQGYSYMLRGDLVTARRKFLKAYNASRTIRPSPIISNC